MRAGDRETGRSLTLAGRMPEATAKWLSEQTGEHYRLLTEAEWEYACRAGSTTRYCFGDDEAQLGDYAWYTPNADGKTHPVGEKKPNAWYLYDTHGNVWEWCADWYAGRYYEQLVSSTRAGMSQGGADASDTASGAASSASRDPSGPESGSARVIRGGSWGRGAGDCRSACRYGYAPSSRRRSLGFRLSRTGPWPSYALTLARQRAQEQTNQRAEATQREPEPKRRFEPYQGFRDALEGGGEAPAMVYLPGGTFLMGGEDEVPTYRALRWDDSNPPDKPKPGRVVGLGAFAIGRMPVTVGEYLRFCEATGGHWPAWLEEGSAYHIVTGSDDHYRKRGVSREAPDLPVIGVSWKDAQAYCAWLREQTGETYDLPTEAEWEYACRAGSTTRYCFGNEEKKLGEYAWYAANADGRLHPVGEKKPNDWGLLDMHGNVWEWVYDSQAPEGAELRAAHPRNSERAARSAGRSTSHDRRPASENSVDPKSSSTCIRRGGSWDHDADDCRSASRRGLDPGDRDYDLGFRLSRTV
jgi:formylglycine-generating enzyme required for sulfatase activity